MAAVLSGKPETAWRERIIDELPDGIALVDSQSVIVWCNARFRQWGGDREPVGVPFYTALGRPEILGPDFSPFHTALVLGESAITKLRTGERRYFQLHVSPLRRSADQNGCLVVVLRNISQEVLQQQKLEAIREAGTRLTDLNPDEVTEMSVDDRIDLLKSNILHCTQHLLDFNTVEVRLLEPATGLLTTLLSEGMTGDAAARPLYAQRQDNGVTGFVAATGQSYLCEDTREDPLYLPGLPDARSSLTVPLTLHEEVIGTFNVESAEPRAFSEEDLVFLEIFARDVAVALNTLELLVAQSVDTVQKSVEAIHRAVALPIDHILNDTVEIIETYLGHDTKAKENLKAILRRARDIKALIQEVGQDMAPSEAVPAVATPPDQRRFRGVRVLVVDADESLLDSAHTILEKQGCVVETARSGGQAIYMVRSAIAEAPYQVVIASVKLPDMSGHGLLVHLKKMLMGPVPLVLMQGFGYDPGHSIVKARQEGLHPKAVLYKPFRVEQLLDVIEAILECRGQA